MRRCQLPPVPGGALVALQPVGWELGFEGKQVCVRQSSTRQDLAWVKV